MKSSHPLWQLFVSRLREFYREPEALFWVYGFPLIMALGLGIAFMHRKPEPLEVDVQQGPYADEIGKQLRDAGINAEVKNPEECRERRRFGKTPLFIVPLASDHWEYVYDEAQSEAVSARYHVDDVLVRQRTKKTIPSPEIELVTEPGNRYIDFFMPGLMGLNIMGGGLWGIGFVLVDMRVRKLFKRLLATPMRRPHFLLAMLLARMVMLLPEMTILLLFGMLVFTVPVRGDFVTLVVTIFVGAAAFAGIGLLVACRAQKTETVSGLMNLVMLPMWLLSGVFFSSKRFPEATQPFIQALPLTQLN